MSDDFWSRYNEIVNALVCPLLPEDGETQEAVAAAEKRLGVRLPGLLRDYYLRTGNRGDLNGSHDRLIELSHLSVDLEQLVFYEENQGVCSWSIALADLASDDPPVGVGLDLEGHTDLTWEDFSAALSEFLITKLLWQCANGGMTYGGVAKVGRDPTVSAPAWRRHADTGQAGLIALWREGQLVVVYGPPEWYLHGGGRTATDFCALEVEFAISWDYADRHCLDSKDWPGAER